MTLQLCLGLVTPCQSMGGCPLSENLEIYIAPLTPLWWILPPVAIILKHWDTVCSTITTRGKVSLRPTSISLVSRPFPGGGDSEEMLIALETAWERVYFD